LSKNYDSRIPCHRVIRSDGRLGGYNRGAKEKRRLLREEGVA
jgi:O6-methylguanine-DNA--protein-cysteine methyltransferase